MSTINSFDQFEENRVYEEFQKRVIKERDDLAIKIDALDIFIESSQVFKGLTPINKMLLKNQLALMQGYLVALEIRIYLFTH